MSLLDQFFTACSMHHLTYDSLTDAQQAARHFLKGSTTLKGICIVGDDDAPKEAQRATANLGHGEFFYMRARDVAPGDFVLVNL
jgi:hypothetical protein